MLFLIWELIMSLHFWEKNEHFCFCIIMGYSHELSNWMKPRLWWFIASIFHQFNNYYNHYFPYELKKSHIHKKTKENKFVLCSCMRLSKKMGWIRQEIILNMFASKDKRSIEDMNRLLGRLVTSFLESHLW